MFQETISDEYIVIQSGTSEGSQIKYRKDNYWYKKDNRGHEGRTEYLCSKLLSFSTLEQSEYVEYEQGYINQNMGCRSKNFLNPGEELITFYRLYYNEFGKDLSEVIGRMETMEERIEYVAVIDILTVLEFASFNHKYTGIAKYPAVTRDLSMVVPKAVLAGQIEHVLTQRGGKILESFQLFDIYEGNQIKEGYKSMAYSLVFRHHDKTLEESEITAAMKKILNGLTDLGIELRS